MLKVKVAESVQVLLVLNDLNALLRRVVFNECVTVILVGKYRGFEINYTARLAQRSSLVLSGPIEKIASMIDKLG